jgi:hypothetical protein
LTERGARQALLASVATIVFIVAGALAASGVQPIEVVATLLVVPVFAAGLLRGRPLGLMTALAAVVAYTVMRQLDVDDAGIASVAVLVLARAGTYAIVAHVGSVSARVVDMLVDGDASPTPDRRRRSPHGPARQAVRGAGTRARWPGAPVPDPVWPDRPSPPEPVRAWEPAMPAEADSAAGQRAAYDDWPYGGPRDTGAEERPGTGQAAFAEARPYGEGQPYAGQDPYAGQGLVDQRPYGEQPYAGQAPYAGQGSDAEDARYGGQAPYRDDDGHGHVVQDAEAAFRDHPAPARARPPEPPAVHTLDPETKLWSAQYLCDRLAAEQARAAHERVTFSLVMVQVPDDPLAALPYRRQLTLLRELGHQFVAGGLVDHLVHVPDRTQHWFAVVLPDVDRAGAQALESRLRTGIRGYLRSRGLALDHLQSASLTAPDDDPAMDTIWESLIGRGDPNVEPAMAYEE